MRKLLLAIVIVLLFTGTALAKAGDDLLGGLEPIPPRPVIVIIK